MLPLLTILCWTIATANGVLLLLSPIKYRAIIGGLWRVAERQLNHPGTYRREWEQRIAGFVITLISSSVLWSIIHSRLMHAAAEEANAPTRMDTNASWLAPAATIFLFAAGLYVLLYPNIIARWSAQQFPEHVVTEETLLRWQMGARLLGAAAIVASALTTYFWTGRPG